MLPDPILPLAHWSLLRCQLLWAYDRFLESDPARKLAYVSSPIAAWLIRSGSITLRFETGEEVFGPGAWIFPREAEAAQIFSTSGVEILSLRFQAEWSYGTPVFDRSATVTIPEQDAPQLTACGEALARFVETTFPEPAQPLKLQSSLNHYLRLQPVFTQWIVAYHEALTAHGIKARTPEMLDDKIRLALQIIETQPLANPLRESELARASGCSVSQLNKLFIKQTSSTPAALWNRRKLAAARSQLLNTQESMKAIAYQLGFSAPEHFTHWFKKHSHHSPLAFRRQHQGTQSL